MHLAHAQTSLPKTPIVVVVVFLRRQAPLRTFRTSSGLWAGLYSKPPNNNQSTFPLTLLFHTYKTTILVFSGDFKVFHSMTGQSLPLPLPQRNVSKEQTRPRANAKSQSNSQAQRSTITPPTYQSDPTSSARSPSHLFYRSVLVSPCVFAPHFPPRFIH